MLISLLFCISFVNFHNAETFEIIKDELLFLNLNAKIAKIFYKNNLVFEKNNFSSLFN
ncbi:7917_t:CDS:2 [Cetraspora pellucida]|uniref:7917_t:CDS:1 n=1 Tax=Cetraspora pellucida TaxID=1433469 RepID=A0A9N8VS60_9GLOM|nr:7917_t:CDS:2 [Cetraspora pellucida]